MAMWGRVVCLLVLWQVLALSRGNTRDLLDDMLTDGEAGNVEGMIDKVGDMLGELVDSLDSINSPCSFKCPNGKRERVKNDGEKMTVRDREKERMVRGKYDRKRGNDREIGEKE